MRKPAFQRTALALLVTLTVVAVAHAAVPPGAAAKGVGISPAPAGVTEPGSPYRYVAIHPRVGVRGVPTIVAKISRGDGRIDRWWRVRGHYFVPAVAYDGSGGGLAGDGRTLVLQRFTPAYPPARSRFAVLDTAVHLNHPLRSGEERPAHAVRRISIAGFYSLHAVSPDGSTAYLSHHFPRRSIAAFELRALDLEGEGPRLEAVPSGSASRLEGLPITRAASPDGRWAYTLYDGEGEAPFLYALDTVRGRGTRVQLPQLTDQRNRFLLSLTLSRGANELLIAKRSAVQGRPPRAPFLSVDTRSFAVHRLQPAVASVGGLPWLPVGIVAALALATIWTLARSQRAPARSRLEQR